MRKWNCQVTGTVSGGKEGMDDPRKGSGYCDHECQHAEDAGLGRNIGLKSEFPGMQFIILTGL